MHHILYFFVELLKDTLMVQFNSLDKVTVVIWHVISHITSKHAMRKHGRRIINKSMTSILMLSRCNWQVKLIAITVNNSYKWCMYIYIYKESKTKVVLSDQKQDPRLCAIL